VAEDAAGNTGWMTDKGHLVTSFAGVPPQSSIIIDRPLDGGTYALRQSVPASYACSGRTGIASCSGTVANGAAVDTSALGNKQFSVTATPLLGNPTTKTVGYSVTYDFGGFQPPISPSSLNVVKAGSAVPVKFTLHGNFGLGILAPTYPRSGAIPCTGGSVVVTDTTLTSGNSSLQYDAGSDTYSYIWKTDKSWSGCRQLLVTLNDGVVHRANFQFK
jgi:hypothetical protein